jgi:hypothetical protein
MLGTIRDIAIIFVALLDIVLLILLSLIAFAAWRLFLVVRADLPPILGTMKRTATTVEGTADFVSTTAATPLIRAVSMLFAITRFLQVLVERGTPRREGPS